MPDDAPKLSRKQVSDLISEEIPNLSKAGVEGVVRNVFRESGGNPKVVGDGGSSGGLFQHHNSRWNELKSFAKDQGTDWSDPRTQVRFAAKELKANYPTLQAQLQKADDPAEAEDSFKRVFERPASIMWANKPATATDRYRYSPYALDEHKGRKGTDLVYMTPGDYLDLSPEMEGEAFTSPSGKSLKHSVDRGEEIEAIPTLDVRNHGDTAMVTDQDGRHRALLAQEEGIDSIPVAIRQTGAKGKAGDAPKEIQGLSGNVLPYDFPKAKDAPKDASVWKRALNSIIPSAEAAERGGVSEGLTPVEGNPFAKTQAAPQPGLKPVEGNPFAEPDGMVMSAINGAGAGFGKMVLGGQELLGKGLDAVGAKAPGDWLVNDARKGIAKLNKEEAPDKAAHPWATGAGEMAGESVLPGGVASKLGGNALRMAATAGGLGGLLQSSGKDDNFWGEKAEQAGIGAAAGAATGVAGDAVAAGLRKAAIPFRDAVKTLMNEGVELTHGQMLGGQMKRIEDVIAKAPGVGAEVRKAQKRSFDTFNRATINRSLADINEKLPDGMVGHEAIGKAEDLFKQAYNQVIPNMRGVRDPTFMQNLGNIIGRAHAPGTPSELPQQYIDELRHTIQTEIVDKFDAGGHMSGDLAQKVGSQLDDVINRLRGGNTYQRTMANALRQADRAFDDMLEAHNPALQAAKERIDAGYAKFKTVQKAATSSSHPDGTFTPDQLNRAVKARDRSKDKRIYARGDAQLQDLANAAREVLPQTVNDSGTAERLGWMGLLYGGHSIEPHTAALLGMGAAAYTKPVSKASNWALNRLAQPGGPTRNALAALTQRGGQMLAPAAGAMAAQNPPNIPTMTVRPGDRQ